MKAVGRSIAIVAFVAASLVLAFSLITWETQDDAGAVDSVPVASEPFPSQMTFPSAPELHEVELRSALEALCANQKEEPENDQWTPEETQAQITTYGKRKQDLSDRLSMSSSAEHLHLAALLDGNPVSRVELLNRAISLNPNDAFLLWGAVQICSEEYAATGCPLRDWERMLLMIDSQNSESWIRVAANRYEAGEIDAAIEAMRHASTAAESRSFWIETIEMIERGFTAGSDYDFSGRATMAFGFAGSELPKYGDYVTMCKDQSARSVDWAYVCLAYGELVENQGKTVMDISIARSIQKLALEALGEKDKLAAVLARQLAYKQELLNGIVNNHTITDRLLTTNPAFFSAYLAAIRTHGESGAREYLKNETSRLLLEQPELACEP